MRITGGTARGIPLKAPKGDATRPATDRMREAVFSSLGPAIEGSRIADLFAGTGAYGLEALSRGAASVHFYETARAALQCLRENIAAVARSCGVDPGVCAIHAADVFAIKQSAAPCDFIFIDPPYDRIAETLPSVFITAVTALSHADTQVVVELPGNIAPEIPGWELVRRLGKTGKDKPSAAIFQQRS